MLHITCFILPLLTFFGCYHCLCVCLCVTVNMSYLELEAKLENNNDERRIILERFVSISLFMLTDSTYSDHYNVQHMLTGEEELDDSVNAVCYCSHAFDQVKFGENYRVFLTASVP